MLALFLLVTRVRADHAYYAIATNDFAITANLLYRRLYSHVQILSNPKKSECVTSHGTQFGPGSDRMESTPQ